MHASGSMQAAGSSGRQRGGPGCLLNAKVPLPILQLAPRMSVVWVLALLVLARACGSEVRGPPRFPRLRCSHLLLRLERCLNCAAKLVAGAREWHLRCSLPPPPRRHSTAAAAAASYHPTPLRDCSHQSLAPALPFAHPGGQRVQRRAQQHQRWGHAEGGWRPDPALWRGCTRDVTDVLGCQRRPLCLRCEAQRRGAADVVSETLAAAGSQLWAAS